MLISVSVGCVECYPVMWTTPSRATRTELPRNTVAVIVNLVDDQGAVRMYEKDTDICVDMVE